VDDLDGLRDTGQLQSALRGDIEIVVGYGAEHPGAWAGVWWDNEPTVRIVAAFTGDAASHGAALRPRLRHPDRLVVESRQHSLSDLAGTAGGTGPKAAALRNVGRAGLRRHVSGGGGRA
jgi:hypothetical protein